jgi:uncharacterized protein (DUF2237 family)
MKWGMVQNVIGTELQPCSHNPLTGFYRDGCCSTGADDFGVHTVCIRATAEFLAFSASVGNDLSTPHPEHGFDGLQPGDQWCLCASRWQEAFEAGMAPPVVLESTHASTLEWIELGHLAQFAITD